MRPLIVAAILTCLIASACGDEQSPASSDSEEDSCAQSGLRDGLALYRSPSSSLVVATVAAVGAPRREGHGRSQTVYTPVTLSDLETLLGSPAPTEVFFHGGTADRHTTMSGDHYLGLVPGGRVMVAIGTDPESLGGPAADPPGSYVQTSWPVDADGNVLISGCMNADDVPGHVPVTASVAILDSDGAVRKVTATGDTVPVAVIRSVARQVAEDPTPTPSESVAEPPVR